MKRQRSIIAFLCFALTLATVQVQAVPDHHCNANLSMSHTNHSHHIHMHDTYQDKHSDLDCCDADCECNINTCQQPVLDLLSQRFEHSIIDSNAPHEHLLVRAPQDIYIPIEHPPQITA